MYVNEKKPKDNSIEEYFCNYCKRTYKTKDSLNKHFKKIHQNGDSSNLNKNKVIFEAMISEWGLQDIV